jgi:hypothetical protein
VISEPMIARLYTGELLCRYGIIHGHGPEADGRLSLIDTYPTWKDAHNALLAECQRGVQAAQDALNNALALRVNVQVMENPYG